MNNVDKQYLNLMRDILDHGVVKSTRSGNVISVFGRSMQFDLQEGLPLLTTKKLYIKGVLHELLWFLKGDTNIKYLVDNNVNIWNDDAYRWFNTLIRESDNFLALKLYRRGEHVITLLPKKWANDTHDTDSIHCAEINEYLKSIDKEKFIEMVKEEYSCYIDSHTNQQYKFGDLGPVYGKQWRGFGQKEIDQMQNIIDTLKKNPDDRRMLCTALNPDVLDEVALPPCHVISQFYTRPLLWQERVKWYAEQSFSPEQAWTDEELDAANVPTRALSCSFTMRSNDFCCGNPFNIASYAILCHIIANICNMVPDRLVYFGGDVHIYANHIDGCHEQLRRTGYDTLPKLIIKRQLTSLDDIHFDDFEVVGYQSDGPIKFPLSVG